MASRLQSTYALENGKDITVLGFIVMIMRVRPCTVERYPRGL